jgi:hypothetical protein
MSVTRATATATPAVGVGAAMSDAERRSRHARWIPRPSGITLRKPRSVTGTNSTSFDAPQAAPATNHEAHRYPTATRRGRRSRAAKNAINAAKLSTLVERKATLAIAMI